MKRPSDVAQIKDPLKRVTAAADLLREIEAATEQAREERDEAALVLRHGFKMEPVDIYRDVIGVSRGMFNRITNRANGSFSKMPGTQEQIIARAKERAETVRTLIAKAEAVRTLRDDAALDLMDGKHGKPVPNADIARATGLSTARVAQLREGVR